ncbi:site-specific integrase [Rhodococcus opacus]|uniref:site-specific integrase n=1 Tax=Rhodococcus opacus TaxID=37919 RepID=UPI002948CA24|nr:site-specific integrase [Rhodococcus opacus]MDV6246705.1 site-specific integrase [Rhodococcus opacus]
MGWGVMHVQTVKTGGIVSSVVLVGADGESVSRVTRFLRYVLDSGRSPNTALAYGDDLRLVFEFFAERGIDGREFRPALALELLGWLRRRPVRGPAQRLGLAAVGSGGRLFGAGERGAGAGRGIELLRLGNRRRTRHR